MVQRAEAGQTSSGDGESLFDVGPQCNIDGRPCKTSVSGSFRYECDQVSLQRKSGFAKSRTYAMRTRTAIAALQTGQSRDGEVVGISTDTQPIPRIGIKTILTRLSICRFHTRKIGRSPKVKSQIALTTL